MSPCRHGKATDVDTRWLPAFSFCWHDVPVCAFPLLLVVNVWPVSCGMTGGMGLVQLFLAGAAMEGTPCAGYAGPVSLTHQSCHSITCLPLAPHRRTDRLVRVWCPWGWMTADFLECAAPSPCYRRRSIHDLRTYWRAHLLYVSRFSAEWVTLWGHPACVGPRRAFPRGAVPLPLRPRKRNVPLLAQRGSANPTAWPSLAARLSPCCPARADDVAKEKEAERRAQGGRVRDILRESTGRPEAPPPLLSDDAVGELRVAPPPPAAGERNQPPRA